MNKCPRCENENLKEREEAVKRLKDIVFGLEDHTEYEEIKKDVQALKYAIKELERTAQEVPVQEQLVTLEVLNNELNINLSQKQYEEIAILDFCTPKYTAYEILKLLKTLSVI